MMGLDAFASLSTVASEPFAISLSVAASAARWPVICDAIHAESNAAPDLALTDASVARCWALGVPGRLLRGCRTARTRGGQVVRAEPRPRTCRQAQARVKSSRGVLTMPGPGPFCGIGPAPPGPSCPRAVRT